MDSLKGRDHLENQGTDLKVILKWILKKWGRMVWTVPMWFSIITSNTLFWEQKLNVAFLVTWVTIQGSPPFCKMSRMVVNTFCCQVHLLYKFKDYEQINFTFIKTAAILDPNTIEAKNQTGVWWGHAKEYRMCRHLWQGC
jgi:hypothetical protein